MGKSEFDNQLFEEFEIVRQSGVCNMIDGVCVIEEIRARGNLHLCFPLMRIYDSGRWRLKTDKYAAFLKEVSVVMSMADRLEKE